jgi:hypothetical protein
VALGQSRHLFAGDRMASEDDRFDAKRVEHRGDVRDERVEITVDADCAIAL